MGLAQFLTGVITLAAITGPLLLAAISLRRLLVPGWIGTPARLAEIVLWLTGLILVTELVGVVGLYRPGFVIAGSVVFSVAVILLSARQASPGKTAPPPTPPVGRIPLAVALFAALGVTFQWSFGTLQGLFNGMYLPNTTWHNAPFAARFVQDAQIGLPHFTEIYELAVWFYPQNSELLHSVGILSLGTDVLSPALNLGWLLLALLAAWVVGRPYGAGPAVLVGVATIFSTGMLVNYGPGDAKNDAMTLFSLLAVIAFLVNGEAQRRQSEGGDIWGRFGFGPLLLAALATGLAVGTRLNYLLPALLLTITVVYLSFRGQRLRSTALWIGGVLLTSGFWYLRNLIVSGNPLPWLKKLGPISLPHPDQLPIPVRPTGTVADYLNDLEVVENLMLPRVVDNLGDLWISLLATIVVFTFAAIFSGPTRTLRTLGIVAILGFIGYLFTPLTASGSPETLSGFGPNLRYVAPAMAIALAIGPLSPLFQKTQMRRNIVLFGLMVILVFTLWTEAPLIGKVARGTSDNFTWDSVESALVLALLLVLVPVGLNALWSRGRQRGRAVLASGVAILAVLSLSYAKTDSFVETRYAAPPNFRGQGTVADFRPAIEWARSLTNKRIGVVGGTVSFKQYFLYGKDLSNKVIYIGAPASNGGFRPIENCVDFRRQVNELDLDYVVAARYFQVPQEEVPLLQQLDEISWLVGLPQTRVVLQGKGYVGFEIKGPLGPFGCTQSP